MFCNCDFIINRPEKRGLMKIVMLLVITLIALPGWAKSPILDWLVEGEDFINGCGCVVSDRHDDRHDHSLVYSDIDKVEYVFNDEGAQIGEKVIHAPAIIKVGGKKYELKWISSTEKTPVPKRAVRFTRTYANDKSRLILNYKTTSVCSPKNVDCEYTGYAVDAILTMDGQTHRLTELKGACGC
jgi:hypothetical protein